MARIWDHEPGLTFTAGSIFTFGIEFVAAVPITVEGVWYFARPAGAPIVSQVNLFEVAGEIERASGPGVALTAGAWTFLPFTAPFVALVGVAYTGTVFASAGECAYDLGGSLPVTSPDGQVEATQGRFQEGIHQFPQSVWTGVHAVDIGYQLSSPAEGGIAPTVGVDLTVTGARAAIAGIQPTVGVDLSVTGARSATAGIQPAVGVDLVITGWRTQVGRPVTAYPGSIGSVGSFFVPRSVAEFPEQGRPIRSFSEVPT